MAGTTAPNRRLGILLLAVLAALALAGWWVLRPPGETAAARVEAERPPAAGAESAPAGASVLAGETAAASRSAEPLPPAPAAAIARPPPESFLRELCGLRGRLIEADGTPAPGLKVELLRIHPDLLTVVFDGGFAPPPSELVEFSLEQGRSDAEGRFLLRNAEAGAFALLGVDLGGPRGTVRVLDVALERGRSHDLGDIVLPPHVTFTGTVADEEGAPIAGARVRVVPQLPVPIPPQALEVGVQDVRHDCAGLVAAGGGFIEAMRIVVEMPPWMRRAFDRLPLPTTSTGADGRFRLPGVPAGIVTLLVDHPGFLGRVRAGLPTGRRAEQDVGTTSLSSGRVVTGRAFAGETPVAGARLFVGAEIPFRIDENVILALGQPAGTTDAEGRFSLSGLPLHGDLLCAIQPLAGDPWTLLGPFDRDDLRLELPPRATLTVQVVDRDEAPVVNAELRFLDESPLNEIPVIQAPRELRGRVSAREDGSYVVTGLPVGNWNVLARAPGFGVGSSQVELAAEGGAVRIVLPAERTLSVRVLDAAELTPVEHALVAALPARSGFLPMPLAAARTDARGTAALRQLPADSGLRLRATHPGHAPAVAPVPGGGEPADAPIELLLTRGGDLVGRVTTGGEAPANPLMLVLEPHGSHELPEQEMVRFGLTGADGTFRIRHLAAGQWGWNVFPRFLFADPLKVVKTAMDEPDELARGRCQIEEGKETRLEIEALPEGELLPATLRGRVRVDGGPGADLEVRLSGRRYRNGKCDESGRFEFSDLRPGEYSLEVVRESDGGRATLHERTLSLAPGEIIDLDVDVRTIDTSVVVRAADGGPAAHAEVRATRMASDDATGTSEGGQTHSVTDAEGRVTLALRSGKWRVAARHAELGRAATTIEIAARTPDPVELRLVQGVVAAGRIEFDGDVPDGEPWYLSLQPVRGGEDVDHEQQWIAIAREERRFEFRTLSPGRYRAHFFAAGLQQIIQSEEFEVGSGGAGDLVLRLRTR